LKFVALDLTSGSVTAMRIIVKATIVADIGHELDIDVQQGGRDNVGGVVVSGDPPDWTEEEAETLLGV
jgi:hypothetical protein